MTHSRLWPTRPGGRSSIGCGKKAPYRLRRSLGHSRSAARLPRSIWMSLPPQESCRPSGKEGSGATFFMSRHSKPSTSGYGPTPRRGTVASNDSSATSTANGVGRNTIMNLLIERTLDLEAAPERVWRAITDAEQLAKWFPDRAVVDLTPGGEGKLIWQNSGVHEFEVVEVDPPRRLVWRWAGGEDRPPAGLRDHSRVDSYTARGRRDDPQSPRVGFRQREGLSGQQPRLDLRAP